MDTPPAVVATTMRLTFPPAATVTTVPLVPKTSGVLESALPSPSASKYTLVLVKSQLSPVKFFKSIVNVSVPLPSLYKVCWNCTSEFWLAVVVTSCIKRKLPTCVTVVFTSFDVTVRVVDPSLYVAVAMLLMLVPATGAAA